MSSHTLISTGRPDRASARARARAAIAAGAEHALALRGDGAHHVSLDKVIATIDYVMAGNVENLDLGSGASKGTGIFELK